MRKLYAAVGVVAVLLLSSCSSVGANDQDQSPATPKVTQNSATRQVIAYEDLARAIDQGHIADYVDRHLQIVGHVRMYLDMRGEQVLVIGEPMPAHEYPTMFCGMSASDFSEAFKYRGSPSGAEGMYDSAFPARVVTVDALFTGRVLGQDVYGAEECHVVK